MWKNASNIRVYRSNKLVLGSGLDLVFRYSVVFAGQAINVMLTHDHDDMSSLFLGLLTLLAIFTSPLQAVHFWLLFEWLGILPYGLHIIGYNGYIIILWLTSVFRCLIIYCRQPALFIIRFSGCLIVIGVGCNCSFWIISMIMSIIIGLVSRTH